MLLLCMGVHKVKAFFKLSIRGDVLGGRTSDQVLKLFKAVGVSSLIRSI